MLNVLQSIEAVSIPLQLQFYGMTIKESISTYGVLTGMALPCILFPSAITNSVSTMLLPTVAEIQTLNNKKELISLIKKVTYSCIFLGSICCVTLLVFGNLMGQIFFHSSLAGDFIVILSWMCPFLYTNNTLISIINGIGNTTLSFAINAVSLGIRIAGVFLLIPADRCPRISVGTSCKPDIYIFSFLDLLISVFTEITTLKKATSKDS